MTGGRKDPRPARSRARLLDAATTLLRSGGPSAVTVDAVTRAANVARATLYRHFPSGNDLLAAAFTPDPAGARCRPSEDRLRDRLIALVLASGRVDRRGAGILTAMSWLALGGDFEQLPETQHTAPPTAPRCARCGNDRRAVRRTVRAISTARRPPRTGRVDRTAAVALLMGPMALGRLSARCRLRLSRIARAAVDGFLAMQRKQTGAQRSE